MIKRYLGTIFIISIFLVPAAASAATADEIRAQIQSLLSQIAALQVQLSSSTPSTSGVIPPPFSVCPTLSRALSRGSQGSDVMSLQHFLIAKGFLRSDLSTGFFGALTESAVQQWQGQNNIDSVGIVGVRTREAIAARCETSTIHACPLYQMPICASGQHIEKGAIGSDGCETAAMCVSDTSVSCPVYSALPACPSGQHYIVTGPPTTDSNGCPVPPDRRCVINSTECPIYNAPPACPVGQHYNVTVPATTDSRGCYIPAVQNCIADVPVACPVYTLTACPTGQHYSVTVPATKDSRGCYVPPVQHCVSDTTSSCPIYNAPPPCPTGQHYYVTTPPTTDARGCYVPAVQYCVNDVSTGTPSIRVTSPNGGEVLSAGTAARVSWEASNIPAPMIPSTMSVGSAQISYFFRLKLIDPSGNVVGYIPKGSTLAFVGTARGTLWDPIELSGGFLPLNQLKVRASVVKQTNYCGSSAPTPFTTAASACLVEEIVATDDSDTWFSVRGATVCDNTITPMTCTPF